MCYMTLHIYVSHVLKFGIFFMFNRTVLSIGSQYIMTHTSENVSCGRMKSDSSLKSLPRNVEIVTNALQPYSIQCEPNKTAN